MSGCGECPACTERSRGEQARSHAEGAPKGSSWYTYILRCEDGSYYVGHTNSVENRFVCHASGHGARHTTVHRPIATSYCEQFDTRRQAVARERQIKRWSRAKKEALIQGNIAQLRELSHSRD